MRSTIITSECPFEIYISSIIILKACILNFNGLCQNVYFWRILENIKIPIQSLLKKIPKKKLSFLLLMVRIWQRMLRGRCSCNFRTIALNTSKLKAFKNYDKRKDIPNFPTISKQCVDGLVGKRTDSDQVDVGSILGRIFFFLFSFLLLMFILSFSLLLHQSNTSQDFYFTSQDFDFP